MPYYQDGKIYKITGTTDEGEELIYIGSTTQKLCKRLTGHKTAIKNRNCSSKQVLLCSDCLITLIELYPCDSREELLMRERYYYDFYKCVNNIRPIHLTGETKILRQEYRIKNAVKISEYKRERYLTGSLAKKELQQFMRLHKQTEGQDINEYLKNLFKIISDSKEIF